MEESAVEKQKKSIWKTVLVIFLIVVVVTIASAYGAGCYYFSKHFYPQTIINDVDCSMMDMLGAKTAFENMLDNYSIVIYGREGVADQVNARTVDYDYNVSDSLQTIMQNQVVYAWPLYIFSNNSNESAVVISFNEELLKAAVDGLCFFRPENLKQPIDAHIGEYNEADKKYELVKEYNGTILDKELCFTCIRDGLYSFAKEVDLDACGCYGSATITDRDIKLNRVYELANKCVSSQIKYDWNGSPITLDGETISKWISVDGQKMNFDRECLNTWVKEQAELNDTYGKKVQFETIDGTVKELKRGAYGWRTDVDAESEELFQLVRQGAVLDREPIYKNTAYVKGQDDIGNSYVEINLSAQHLYLWMGGEVVLEDDFVSGNMSNGNGTPGGVFGITYKQKDAVLRGANYTTPVKYWMPFNGNVGMHDATWRRSFGGDIYLLNGSHGCVNMRLSTAKEMFSYMEKKFPVICYY